MKIRIACLAIASAAALGTAAGVAAHSAAPDRPRAVFRTGVAATGAAACAGCHALRAAGSTATLGPDLDQLAPDDDAAAIAEMIRRPNAEIVPGYARNVMPRNYARTLTARQIRVLSLWIDRRSAHGGD